MTKWWARSSDPVGQWSRAGSRPNFLIWIPTESLWTRALLARAPDVMHTCKVLSYKYAMCWDDDEWCEGRASAQRFSPEGTQWASERAAIPAELVSWWWCMQQVMLTCELGVICAVGVLSSSCRLGEWCVGERLNGLLGLLACMGLRSVHVFGGRWGRNPQPNVLLLEINIVMSSLLFMLITYYKCHDWH